MTPRVDFEPEQLLDVRESPGWELAHARARPGRGRDRRRARARTPTIASRSCSPSSTAATCGSRSSAWTPAPLARYVKHLARWYLEAERSEPVARVAHTLLDRGARGLGLEES